MLKKITPHDSRRYFRITVDAYMRSGDRASAEAAAKHFMDVAKTDSDRAYAEILLNEATPRAEAPGNTVPAPRRTAPSEPASESRPAAPARSSSAGQFVELECRGDQARMILETASGRKVFLIEDPGNVVITGQGDWHMDMTCGPQKNRPKVEIGYGQPRANQKGIDGIVSSLNFK